MKLDQLDDTERLALLGLLKLVIRADHELSSEESTTLQAVARDMGVAVFRATVALAQQRLKSRRDVEHVAQLVERPAARILIYDLLYRTASAHGIVEAEGHELRWIAALWKVDCDPVTLEPVEAG